MTLPKHCIAGIVSGTLYSLSLPPFSLPLAIWLFPIPLVLAAVRAQSGEAVLVAYTCGLVVSGQVFYGVVAYDAWLCLLLFLVCPVWMVLPVVLTNALAGITTCRAWVLLMPVFWVANEYVWLKVFDIPLDTGVALARSNAPLQLASIAGSAGLSFSVLLAGSLGALSVHYLLESVNGLAAFTMLAGVGTISAAYLIGSTLPAGDIGADCVASVDVAQPGIPAHKSRDSSINPAYRQQIRAEMTRYLALAAGTAASDFVWPEGSGAFTSFRVGQSRKQLQQFADHHGKNLFISVIDHDAQGKAYNSVIALTPGKPAYKYDKIATLPITESGITPGLRPGVAGTRQGDVGQLICFEACFPERARAVASAGPGYLLISSSDVAFGVSNLPELHLSMAILRAVENRRSVVHASNGGPSAIIDPYGRIVGKSGFLTPALLSGCVPGPAPVSTFTRIGYHFRTLCLVLSLLLIIGVAVYCVKHHRSPLSATGLTLPATAVALLSAIAASLALCCVSVCITASRSAETVPAFRQALAMLTRSPLAAPGKRSDLHTQEQLFAATFRHLAGFYGVMLEEQGLANAALAGKQAVTPDRIVQIASTTGFRAWRSGEDRQSLPHLRPPFLARIGRYPPRYSVVHEVSGGEVVVFEPRTGYGAMQTAVFLQHWDGEVVYIRPPGSRHLPPQPASQPIDAERPAP